MRVRPPQPCGDSRRRVRFIRELTWVRVPAPRPIMNIYNEIKKISEDICDYTKCMGACCKSCGRSMGWFKTKERFELTKDKYGWDINTGFLGDNGCIIPWEERSTTCLTHTCMDIRMNKEQKELFRYLKSKLLLDRGKEFDQGASFSQV